MLLPICLVAAGAVILGTAIVKDAAAEKPTTLPAIVDLRPMFEKFNLPNRRQGARGTCSVFATTGALEYASAVSTGHGERLSVEFLNWASHKAAGRTADGGFFSELWNGYEVSGICADADLPYSDTYNAELNPPEAAKVNALSHRSKALHLTWIKEWNPHTGVSAEQLTAIKTAISKKWPVMGGFRWPKLAHWRDDVLQMCAAADVFDGHSVLLVGYRDDATAPGGGVFLIRNSGSIGKDGWMPYAYIEEFMNDAAWIGVNGK